MTRLLTQCNVLSFLGITTQKQKHTEHSLEIYKNPIYVYIYRIYRSYKITKNLFQIYTHSLKRKHTSKFYIWKGYHFFYLYKVLKFWRKILFCDFLGLLKYILCCGPSQVLGLGRLFCSVVWRLTFGRDDRR